MELEGKEFERERIELIIQRFADPEEPVGVNQVAQARGKSNEFGGHAVFVSLPAGFPLQPRNMLAGNGEAASGKRGGIFNGAHLEDTAPEAK